MRTDICAEARASSPLPPRLLAAIAIERCRTVAVDVAEPAPFHRTFACVERTLAYDVWVIRWGPCSRASLHDHGGSAGVLCVVEGELAEYEPTRPRRVVRCFDHRVMPPSHVHEVVNECDIAATSVHVYSPPLDFMRHYVTRDRDVGVVHHELVSL